MKIITYRITLLEPALVTAIDGDPNSAVAYDFLPGSVLRGALVKKYVAAHPALTPQTLLKADQPEEVRRLFFDGTTRYLNGYVQINGQRTLPAPLAWQQPQDKKDTIYDFSVAEVIDTQKWHGFVGSYCQFEGGNTVQVVKPERQIAIHTQRDRVYGRPLKGSGAVYRYEALAAGQTFEAAIVCDNDSDTVLVEKWLPGSINVGGSRTGGYGRAQVDQVQIVDKSEVWREAGGEFTVQEKQCLTLTLVSDALVRDAAGQFVVNAKVLAQYYQARLHVPILPLMVQRKQGSLVPGPDDQMVAFVRGRLVGGFNRKWGLPLPQALAVQAGSTIVFDTHLCDAAHLQLLAKQLKELEQTGIGERRAEGFGRVAANWHTAATWTVPDPESDPKPTPLEITDDAAQKVAQRMARRLLRAQLDDRVVAKANELKIKLPPRRAQLSRLRNIIADELMQESPDAQRVAAYMKLVRERSTARKQFESAKVVGENKQQQRLADWLIDTAQQDDEEHFKKLFALKSQDLRAFGKVQPDLGTALRAEYVLRLIDLVLAHAAKEEVQE